MSQKGNNTTPAACTSRLKRAGKRRNRALYNGRFPRPATHDYRCSHRRGRTRARRDRTASPATGVPRFHGRQIFQWIHRRGVTDFAAMTDLGRELREGLPSQLSVGTPTVARQERSTDGTTKFLLELADGNLIETVFIPDTPSQTFCLSTQVGCAMKCAFCLTARMGIIRNLTAGEIVGQVRVLVARAPHARPALQHRPDGDGRAAPQLRRHDEGAADPRRRARAGSVSAAGHPSTVGVLPALERLAHEPFMPNLAISLHSTTEDQRDRLVPINRKYGLQDLLDACRRFPLKRRNRITFEYVMLDRVNDTPRMRAAWSSCSTGSRQKSICCRSTPPPAFPSNGRQTSA